MLPFAVITSLLSGRARARPIGFRIFSVLSFLLCLSACAKRETPVEAGIRTQTLHFGNAGEPASLDPHAATLLGDWMILTALFEGLVNLAGDGRTVMPGVAERWEVSADGLTYTFHLRSNARWSNGNPITAEDFVRSMRRLLNPALGFSFPELIDPIVGAREYLERRSSDFSTVGVEETDRFTLRFRLRYRAPYFLSLVSNLSIGGMPVHLPSVEKFGGLDRRDGKWTDPGKLVSNGPFVLKEWRHNQVVVLARNEHYWDAARVRLREVRFYPSEHDDVEERAYRAGQLHVTYGLPTSKIQTYMRSRARDLQRVPLLHTFFISFNCTRPPFTDARVRRAFALAVDRARLTAATQRERAQPARSFVLPGTGKFDPPPLKVSDPAAAQRLLAAAGFPAGRGLPPIELRVPNRGADRIAIAETLQQAWTTLLGAHVSVVRMETKTMYASLFAHDFHAAVGSHFYTVDDPSDPLARGEKNNPGNYSTWHHPRFEEAVVAARNASTDSERFAAFALQEEILAEEAPYVPLFHEDRIYLVHPSVKGWQSNPFNLVDWRELWLEAPR